MSLICSVAWTLLFVCVCILTSSFNMFIKSWEGAGSSFLVLVKLDWWFWWLSPPPQARASCYHDEYEHGTLLLKVSWMCISVYMLLCISVYMYIYEYVYLCLSISMYCSMWEWNFGGQQEVTSPPWRLALDTFRFQVRITNTERKKYIIIIIIIIINAQN